MKKKVFISSILSACIALSSVSAAALAMDVFEFDESQLTSDVTATQPENELSDITFEMSEISVKASATNPTITKVTAGDGMVTVDWAPFEDSDFYRVCYKISGTKDWHHEIIEEIDDPVFSYTVTGLTNSTKYEFLVQAFTDSGWTKSTSADIVKATPYALVNPKIKKLTPDDGKVTVEWYPVDGAKWYRVFYKTSQTGWTSKKVSGKINSQIIDGLENGTKYAFVVKAAINGQWTTAKTTDVVKITTYKSVNPKITKVTAGDRRVNVKWNAVEGATSYRVFYKVSGTKNWSSIKVDKSSTSYTVKNLTPNVKYEFLVKAAINGKWTTATGKHIVTATPTIMSGKSSSASSYPDELPESTLE